eukprot:12934011-Prorocentrum_lima.AAC.1
MGGHDTLHTNGIDRRLVLIARKFSRVGTPDMRVIASPCSRVRELARRIRDWSCYGMGWKGWYLFFYLEPGRTTSTNINSHHTAPHAKPAN